MIKVALMRNHDDPPLAVVSPGQEGTAAMGGADGEGERAMDKHLGGNSSAVDVKFRHTL